MLCMVWYRTKLHFARCTRTRDKQRRDSSAPGISQRGVGLSPQPPDTSLAPSETLTKKERGVCGVFVCVMKGGGNTKKTNTLAHRVVNND